MSEQLQEKVVCVKCGCPEHEVNAAYCHNCGTPLNGNYCTNSNCELNDRDEPMPLDPTYCYCDVCGSETEYFRQGFIKPKIYNQE